MRQIVLSKNNLFFYLLLFGYIFGVILYDFLKFDYTDEILALFLVLFAGITIWERKSIKELHFLIWIVSIFSFYAVYSFWIGSNVPQAIFMDFVIQIKPFLAFYCAWLIAPTFTNVQKKITTVVCLIMGGVILIAVLTGNMWTFFGHPSRLATSATITALLFFYCSSYSWSDIIAFIALISIGLLSTRSKAYGFWGVAVFILIYCKTGGSLKLNIKAVLALLVVIFLSVALSWEKIVLYYIDGMMNSEQMWSRPAMMITAFQILFDYFPFGSGFASFATFASGTYYSKTYAEYGIDHLYGISKEWPSFITDAYYPELAQFGIVGVSLYISFWITIMHQSRPLLQKGYYKEFIIAVLICIFFAIEGIADATFVHNRGLFILMLLGLIIPHKSSQSQTPQEK